MNRTVVDFVAAQPITCTKPVDFVLDLALLFLQPRKLRFALRQ